MSVFRVLVIDDETSLLEMLRRAFSLMNCEMVGASSLAEGLAHAMDQEFDIILLDNHFPEGHCDAIVPALASSRPGTPVIIITGNDADRHVENALGAGAREVLPKPFGLAQLAQTIRRYCEKFPDIASRVA